MIITEMSSVTILFPALTLLKLGKRHLAALAKQGTLHAEGHGEHKQYYKLRFRMEGKQQVRYVGNKPAFVNQVKQELMQLQKGTKTRRQLRRLVRDAMACLRKTKHQLMPLLPLVGRCFHGREIRRCSKHQNVSVSCKETLNKETINRRIIMEDRCKVTEEVGAAKGMQNATVENSPKAADRYKERLQELRAAALEISNPLQAVTRVAMTELFEVGSLMSTIIKTELAGGRSNLRGISEALPVINSLALVHRQASRYVQQDRDLSSVKDSGSADI